MFFFIGGVQPKTVTLDESPRTCPSCGLPQARLKRIDHYLSVFFIPIFPVKRGTPFLVCDQCGRVSSGEPDSEKDGRAGAAFRCPSCGSAVDPAFRFCPYCGQRVR